MCTEKKNGKELKRPTLRANKKEQEEMRKYF